MQTKKTECMRILKTAFSNGNAPVARTRLGQNRQSLMLQMDEVSVRSLKLGQKCFWADSQSTKKGKCTKYCGCSYKDEAHLDTKRNKHGNTGSCWFCYEGNTCGSRR